MFPNTPFFKIIYTTLLLSLTILILNQIQFIFKPMKVLIETLLLPFLIAGVLYYLFRPIVSWFVKKNLPKGLAILTIYGIFLGLLTTIFYFVGPALSKQISHLIENIPTFSRAIEQKIINLQSNQFIQDFQLNERIEPKELTYLITEKTEEFIFYLGNNILSIISTVTGTIILLIVVPFILFYLLKEGDKLQDNLTSFLPTKHKSEAKTILKDLDFALSSYIQGQIIVSVFVGTFVYIGYLIIDLEYSLILALIAMITNVIPFLGPFIGLLPALIVGLLTSWKMALYVLVVVVVVQQIESNLISPQVMGKKLSIHPLTIILILLFAGRFAGILGLLLAVPLYAVLKVIISHIYGLLKLKNKEKTKKENPFITRE